MNGAVTWECVEDPNPLSGDNNRRFLNILFVQIGRLTRRIVIPSLTDLSGLASHMAGRTPATAVRGNLMIPLRLLLDMLRPASALLFLEASAPKADHCAEAHKAGDRPPFLSLDL